MSGAFCGNEVPSGVAADAFFQKGSSMGSLLRVLEVTPRPERMTPRHPSTSDFIQIPLGGQGVREEGYVTVVCPECLRPFQLSVGGEDGPVREAGCVHCHAPIRYAIAEASDLTPWPVIQRQADQNDAAAAGRADYFC
jgi:hypothetical protein